MQYCPKCRINIRGSKQCCPLCRGDLTGEPEADVFPMFSRKLKSVSLIRILSFVVCTLIIAMLVLLYLSDLRWPVVVIILAAVGWMDIILTFYYRYNLIKLITLEFIAGVLICFYIDRHFGFTGWSLKWVIPFAILAVFIATLLIGIFSRRRFEDVILFLIFDILCAFLQLIGIAKGLNTFPYPAVIITAVLSIALIALLIFRFRDVKNASGKWFNI